MKRSDWLVLIDENALRTPRPSGVGFFWHLYSVTNMSYSTFAPTAYKAADKRAVMLLNTPNVGSVFVSMFVLYYLIVNEVDPV